MKQRKDVVLSFIRKRFNDNCHWMDGNCYFFAVILQSRFPHGTIIYDPIDGHFLYKIGNRCYDFLGRHHLPEIYYDWKILKFEEPNLYRRIKKDCTM